MNRPTGRRRSLTSRPLTRRTFLAAIAAGAATAAAGCTPTEPRHIALAGGEPGGFFDQFTRLLAAAVNDSGTGFVLESRQTAGTLENLDLLRSGAVQTALALADAVGANTTGLAAIGRVYQTYWQLAVPVDSPIRTVADLRGRTVSLGAIRSGTRFTALRILAAGGLEGGAVTERPTAVADVGAALAAGEIEAALFAGGVPLPAVAQTAGDGIRLLGLGAETQRLRELYGPVYRPARIPDGVYATDGETQTLGVASLLLARTDVPDDVASALVDVLAQRPADLVPAETLGTQFLDPRALISTAGVPLHPGAAAAYRRLHG